MSMATAGRTRSPGAPRAASGPGSRRPTRPVRPPQPGSGEAARSATCRSPPTSTAMAPRISPCGAPAPAPGTGSQPAAPMRRVAGGSKHGRIERAAPRVARRPLLPSAQFVCPPRGHRAAARPPPSRGHGRGRPRACPRPLRRAHLVCRDRAHRSRAPGGQPVMLAVKRAFDIATSATALLLASPLLALVAIAIKLEGPRHPLFFNDTVMGRAATRFTMFKFRTMVPHAIDYASRPEVTSGNPHVTRVGAVLRRLKLDELPQLWNVLRGDMSVVGPRPMDPVRYERATPFQRQRLIM